MNAIWLYAAISSGTRHQIDIEESNGLISRVGKTNCLTASVTAIGRLPAWPLSLGIKRVAELPSMMEKIDRAFSQADLEIEKMVAHYFADRPFH